MHPVHFLYFNTTLKKTHLSISTKVTSQPLIANHFKGQIWPHRQVKDLVRKLTRTLTNDLLDTHPSTKLHPDTENVMRRVSAGLDDTALVLCRSQISFCSFCFLNQCKKPLSDWESNPKCFFFFFFFLNLGIKCNSQLVCLQKRWRQETTWTAKY